MPILLQHFRKCGGIEHFCMCSFNKILFLFYYFFIHLLYFIYLFLAAGLRCCVRAFSSCGERGLLFIVVRGLLIAVASLVAEHGLQVPRLQ